MRRGNIPSLSDEVRYLKGVGPKKAEILSTLGIRTVADLLNHYPFRLLDFSRFVPMALVKPGEDVTVAGKVISSAFVGSQRGQALRIRVSDGSGVISLVWYNMPYMHRNFPPGMEVFASGRAEWRRGGLEIAHPVWQPKAPGQEIKGPLIPVYHGTLGMNSAAIGKMVKSALETYGSLMPEDVPPAVMAQNGFVTLRQALRDIHVPDAADSWYAARRALAFREMLHLQIALLYMREEAKRVEGPGAFHDFALAERFVESLPFSLTSAQERAIGDIKRDLSSGQCMNRLLQGDVGSGKTVVAVYGLLAAVANGFQGALLAPTEILAEQHRGTLEKLCRGLVRVGHLSGSTKPAEKQRVLAELASGDIDILVGTHAMLEKGVTWQRLGVVVTDEQHRFGVRQRLALSENSAVSPHVLVMSATPIPRSLALTLYGDLDVTVIDALPPGRVPVNTVVVDARGRREAYARVREEVKAGRQAYVVCPLIKEGVSGRKAAEAVAEELAGSYLQGLSIGLIHGDLPRKDVLAAMSAFLRKDIDVLVSTTVIEVGVDVPNATVMVVEDADTFGLATLHQLRGRIGRGKDRSYCYLVASAGTERGQERLLVMETMSDGFAVAEADLEQRGPGQFFGVSQHGLPEIKVRDLQLTVQVVSRAREQARAVLAEMAKPDPEPSIVSLVDVVRTRFGDLFATSRSR
ncbi:MAG: ATP-dependent DNA helicase RecG [Bacillota bacterium]